MDRLPACSSREVVRALKRAGFVKARAGKGSHQPYKRVVDGRTVIVVVPLDKDTIPRPTLAQIVALAELTREEFAKYLR